MVVTDRGARRGGGDGRVRVAIDAVPLLGARTGIGLFCHELVTRLALRPELELVAFAATWSGRGQLAEVVPGGVRVVTRPMAARPLRELWMRTDQPTIERWTGPVDVVHGTNYVVPPARRAAQLVSIHDLTCVRFPELCTADTLQYPTLIERAVRRGAHVHTIEAFRSDVSATFGVAPERVHCIGNGISPWSGGDAARGRKLAGGDRYLLAIGTIEPRKDYPTLIRAFDTLGDADPALRLVIAGGDGWGADAVDAALAASRHRNRVVRTGWVDDADRAGLLAGATVFVYPSIYEGFGFPVLEAMQAGVPVVSTEVGGIPDTAGGAAVLVRSGAPAALAAAIGEVLTVEGRAAELVAKGHANVERFSWDEVADRFAALYLELAGGR